MPKIQPSDRFRRALDHGTTHGKAVLRNRTRRRFTRYAFPEFWDLGTLYVICALQEVAALQGWCTMLVDGAPTYTTDPTFMLMVLNSAYGGTGPGTLLPA